MSARSQRGDVVGWIALLGVLCVAVLIVGGISLSVWNATYVQHKTCTVDSKDRTSHDGKSDARLYTKDCGVLHVSDSWLSWHFNSADTYAGIDAGKTYDVTTRGHRIPFLSMFPNVVDANEVAR